MPAGSGRYPSGQRGQTVNLLADAFGGSNPPLPTTSSGGNSSAVERQPSKLGVAGSNPVSRSTNLGHRGAPRVPRGAPSVWGVGSHIGAHMKIESSHVAEVAQNALGEGTDYGCIM